MPIRDSNMLKGKRVFAFAGVLDLLRVTLASPVGPFLFEDVDAAAL